MASNEAQIFGGQSEAKKAIYLLTSDQKKYIKQIILFSSEDYSQNLNIKFGPLIRGQQIDSFVGLALSSKDLCLV